MTTYATTRHSVTRSSQRFRQLFWWRLRYFASATFRLLIRRWQAVLLVLLSAAPAMTPLMTQLHILGMPILSFFEIGHFQRAAGVWSLLIVLAVTWSNLQADALKGGSGWTYMALMLSPRQAQCLNLAVLTITDLPLLIPFAAAETTWLNHSDQQTLAVPLAMALLGVQLPIIQLLAWQNIPAMIVCLIAHFAGLSAIASGKSALVLVLIVTTGNLISLSGLIPTRRLTSSGMIRPPTWLRLSASYSPLRNMAAINLRYLLGSQPWLRQPGLSSCAILPLVLLESMHRYGFNSTAITLILSLILIPLVLGVAGQIFNLQHLQHPMMAINTVYGFNNAWLLRVAQLVLQVVFILFCLPLTIALGLHCQSWRVLLTLPIGMLTVAACVRLNVWNLHQALAPKFILTLLAYAGLIQCLLPSID